MDRTYKIFYRLFPRSRMLHELTIKADSQRRAELIFSVSKKLSMDIDFSRCRHIQLVAVFEMEAAS